MTLKKATPKLTVSRKIQVKNIVTESFRKDLLKQLVDYETQEKKRLLSIEPRLKTLNKNDVLFYELESMRQKIETALKEIPVRKKQIEEMKDGTLYYTGTIEGMVNLSVGDDFYKKLYGMDLILKDGCVQEIKMHNVTSFAPLPN
ncbi:MAG: YlqD family protein [bacterium]